MVIVRPDFGLSFPSSLFFHLIVVSVAFEAHSSTHSNDSSGVAQWSSPVQ